MYVPVSKPISLGTVDPPGLSYQSHVYGEVPPIASAVAVPSLELKHFSFSKDVIETSNSSGSVITTSEVSLQLLSSVTST